MYIQYVGFEVAASSRVYAFHVINAPDAARDFTVTVQSQAFRPDGLKLQDGPGICFTRLGQELQGQTQESPAERHFTIGERDIKDYLGKYHLDKAPGKKEKV
jgi:hypothetical protein